MFTRSSLGSAGYVLGMVDDPFRIVFKIQKVNSMN